MLHSRDVPQGESPTCDNIQDGNVNIKTTMLSPSKFILGIITSTVMGACCCDDDNDIENVFIVILIPSRVKPSNITLTVMVRLL